MCRLSGFYLTKMTKMAQLKAKIDLLSLMEKQEAGGSEASGLAFVTDFNKYLVIKDGIPASEFVVDPKVSKTLEFYHPRAIIGHCRQPTHGTPTDNKNNHPLYTKSGLVYIHNGVINNADELFKKYKFTRDGEVDSEIIGKLIEYYLLAGKSMEEAIQSASKELRGSMALAVIHATEPDTLYLVRRDNFLSIVYDKKTGIIYFATQEDALKSVLLENKSIMGYFDYTTNASNFIVRDIKHGTGLRITKTLISEFTVEDPPYNYQQSTTVPINSYIPATDKEDSKNNPWCIVHHTYYSSPNCKHKTEAGVEIDNMWNQKRTKKVMTRDSESEISDYFKATEPIKKPSEHTIAEIEARMNILDELAYTITLSLPQQTELRRLENAWEIRNQKLNNLEGGEDTPSINSVPSYPLLSGGD